MSSEHPPSTGISTDSDRRLADAGSYAQCADKQDSHAESHDQELRSELMRYGVDPRDLDSTAMELYALFRIPPESVSGSFDSSAVPDRVTSERVRPKLVRLFCSVLNVMGFRGCVVRGNRSLCVLAAATGTLYALIVSGSKYLAKGMPPHLI